MLKRSLVSLLEELGDYAVKVFSEFEVLEEGDSLTLFAPNEELLDWAKDFLIPRLRGKVGRRVRLKLFDRSTNLNPKYTFENFVVGKRNEVAYKVCLEVSSAPGYSFNPLFLYGKVGVGKTHLLNAIGNECYSRGYKVLYLQVEDLYLKIYRFIKEGKLERLRETLKSYEVLLIDDVQFLSGKERTQVELFNLMNYMFLRNRQMVLASDREPKKLLYVSERLISRFEQGLVVELGLDEETKRKIIERKLKERGLKPTKELIDYLSERTSLNAREVEGAINRYLIYGFEEEREEESKGLEEVIGLVLRHFNLSERELMEGRDRRSVLARQVAMYLSVKVLGIRLWEVAIRFKRRNHSIVIYSVKKVEELIKRDRRLKNLIEHLKGKLK